MERSMRSLDNYLTTQPEYEERELDYMDTWEFEEHLARIEREDV